MDPAEPEVETFEGQCQCGQARYRVVGTPATLFACHCTDCQRQSSSAFGMALWVRDADARLVRGTVTQWVRPTPSGRSMACSFCPVCGTRLFHRIQGSPFLSIKPGTLDRTKALEPVGHIWTASRQSWVPVPAGALQYEGNPADFEALFRAWGAQRGFKAPDRA